MALIERPLLLASVISIFVLSTSADNVQQLKLPSWSVIYDVNVLNLSISETLEVGFVIAEIQPALDASCMVYVHAVDKNIAHVDSYPASDKIRLGTNEYEGKIKVKGLRLGHTKIYVELHRMGFKPKRSREQLDVIVMRHWRVWDTVFQTCVAIFVVILYVNFGAVLDLDDLKRILLRPVGPAIGLVGQFLVMPLLSFFIGYLVFRDNIELRLGLFFTGTAPGGGSSNIFTVILNGNLNLSVAMTAISNLVAFGMMPLWIFTLGAVIFRDGNFAVPYQKIAMMSFSLMLPLVAGIMLQKLAPNVAKKMTKFMKSASLLLIIVIMVIGFTVNSYMFQLFTVQTLIASSALPWLGYAIGWGLASVLQQPPKDALTIAIETGIQNTGIAIFMINFTLPQPQADMTSAVPVVNSLMVPLPLILLAVVQFCRKRVSIEEVEPSPTKEQQTYEVTAIMSNTEIGKVATMEKGQLPTTAEGDRGN